MDREIGNISNTLEGGYGTIFDGYLSEEVRFYKICTGVCKPRCGLNVLFILEKTSIKY